jgi:hypothetical protein
MTSLHHAWWLSSPFSHGYYKLIGHSLPWSTPYCFYHSTCHLDHSNVKTQPYLVSSSQNKIYSWPLHPSWLPYPFILFWVS